MSSPVTKAMARRGVLYTPQPELSNEVPVLDCDLPCPPPLWEAGAEAAGDFVTATGAEIGAVLITGALDTMV